MSEDNTVISINNLGKMYKLYKNSNDKILDAFGLNYFKKNYYREFWALRGVNLTINKGERVGFIGHNGAGKSTLLKLITGNIRPSEGEVQVNGNIQALLEMGTGFHPEFTGRENIRASLAYQGISKDEISRCEEEIIEFTELGDYIEQPVKSYSAGMYSRLAFATTTAIVPEVMIIDEVLGAGDAYFNGKCVDRMRKLTSEEGATVLFVSHDLQSVQNLCDRVIWINKGKIMYDGEVLTGIKLYLQSVRRNEEQRLKLRDMKALKFQAFFADKESEIYDVRTFRFICKEGKKPDICRIYKISVFVEGKEIDIIDVGGSMDNDPSSNCHIDDEIGKTCWGNASREGDEYYREYRNDIGNNGYAPFVIKISKLYSDKIELSIDAYVEGSKEVLLEEYSENERCYHKLAYLSLGRRQTVVAVGEENDVKVGEKKGLDYVPVSTESIDRINTDKASIDNVTVYGENGVEGNVFSYRNNVGGIGFNLFLYEEKKTELYITVLIYNMKGDLIHSTLQKCDLKSALGKIEINYPIEGIKFGPGEYLVSIGIYDHLDINDNTKEQDFLVLFDRALSFCIEKPIDYALVLGSVNTESEIDVKIEGGENYKCSLVI